MQYFDEVVAYGECNDDLPVSQHHSSGPSLRVI